MARFNVYSTRDVTRPKTYVKFKMFIGVFGQPGQMLAVKLPV